ncbi:NAD-dependent epimerase/dehydratase family protein [Mycolicibacterium sp. P9-64]|uniref:NAD-dependent epimerase/dehydratase family protein n=1 Tax=Mycolicibacterium sp. P9-64 TaxID=2024612 RepID=UPI0011F08E4A|nr:NAD-dependent epimerase/dehydratase family protein [Mycolicibacterium sp. P9-64]KAA0087021.1 NAD-dependent epimerase/dehydratase family protein [Mycolicibacterium sp. P9-64]
MRVFVTGPTGYLGGSIAERLVAEGHTVTGLVRSQAKAPLLEARGIDAVFGTLDDRDILTRAAQAADVVVHAASADHPASVIALVTALERSSKTLIHTTGSAFVADHADGEYRTDRPLSEDDYHEPVPYQRARVDMNRYVRQAATDKGIRTIVICPTMVYGTGRGLAPDSDQIPQLIALSRKLGAGAYFGKGLNRYSNVHIDDLVDLYLLAIDKAPGGALFFAENGNNSFKEIAEMISGHLGFGNLTVSVPVEQIIAEFGEAGRLGVASNSYVSSVNAHRLGWSPSAPSLAQWLQRLPRPERITHSSDTT